MENGLASWKRLILCIVIVVPAQVSLKRGAAQSFRLANLASIFINLIWYDITYLLKSFVSTVNFIPVKLRVYWLSSVASTSELFSFCSFFVVATELSSESDDNSEVLKSSSSSSCIVSVLSFLWNLINVIII